MVDLDCHGQVDIVGAGDHSHIGPGPLVRTVDGMGVPLRHTMFLREGLVELLTSVRAPRGFPAHDCLASLGQRGDLLVKWRSKRSHHRNVVLLYRRDAH